METDKYYKRPSHVESWLLPVRLRLSDQKETYTQIQTSASYYCREQYFLELKKLYEETYKTHVQLLVQEYENGTVTLSLGKQRF